MRAVCDDDDYKMLKKMERVTRLPWPWQAAWCNKDEDLLLPFLQRESKASVWLLYADQHWNADVRGGLGSLSMLCCQGFWCPNCWDFFASLLVLVYYDCWISTTLWVEFSKLMGVSFAKQSPPQQSTKETCHEEEANPQRPCEWEWVVAPWHNLMGRSRIFKNTMRRSISRQSLFGPGFSMQTSGRGMKFWMPDFPQQESTSDWTLHKK